jgi:hypothetical protein
MAIAVASGSNEELLVEITDHRGLLSDLSSAGPKWELTDDANAFVFGDGTYANAEAATAQGMTIAAQVDHAGLTAGQYALYVWFQEGTQEIRRGPYWYKVV